MRLIGRASGCALHPHALGMQAHGHCCACMIASYSEFERTACARFVGHANSFAAPVWILGGLLRKHNLSVAASARALFGQHSTRYVDTLHISSFECCLAGPSALLRAHCVI